MENNTIHHLLAEIQRQELSLSKPEILKFVLSCIDLTTLEGSDNSEKITGLCQKAVSIPTAAVCVYPVFARQAITLLSGTSVKVATVAGAFPAGQIPIELKIQEVAYAIEQGAQEIDMVISRGKFLEGNDDEAASEIAAIKKTCGDNILLKVILETGELKDLQLIFKASELAMDAGADFIKTSTGKIPVNATPESFATMCIAIKNFYQKTGKPIGIKPAGGISDVETTLFFVKILENILGTEWMTPRLFRIGASRLADVLLNELSGNKEVNNLSKTGY